MIKSGSRSQRTVGEVLKPKIGLKHNIRMPACLHRCTLGLVSIVGKMGIWGKCTPGKISTRANQQMGILGPMDMAIVGVGVEGGWGRESWGRGSWGRESWGQESWGRGGWGREGLGWSGRLG